MAPDLRQRALGLLTSDTPIDAVVPGYLGMLFKR